MTGPVHDILIVGAGQGGLSVSYYLCEAGVKHLVLDRGGIAHAWAANRWDSFCLVTPNWTVNLPGKPYAGDDHDGFMERDEFVRYMKDWARDFGAPVQCSTDVTRVSQANGHFLLETSRGPMRARQVVLATATYQKPKIPAIAAEVPAEIRQIHAEDYKNPSQAREGAVLVVGSGQTGCQVVEDMLRAGRRVYLSVARTGRLPRRYRGKDCLYWQQEMGLLERTPDMLETSRQRFVGDPHLTGRDGGATVSLHDFRRRGVTLLGRLDRIEGNEARLRDDLAENIAFSDRYAAEFRQKVDAFIADKGIKAGPAAPGELAGEPQAGDQPVAAPDRLDLKAAGIRTIIWATGFTYDFSWVDGLETDSCGYPVTDHGRSSIHGLYFCGLNWMTKRKSGILYGVAEDAREVAESLIGQAANPQVIT